MKKYKREAFGMQFTVVENSFLPPRGYSAINLGWIFTRNADDVKDNSDTLQHEAIHRLQMREILYVPFFLLYVLEYFVKLCICWNADRAYRSISFEQEAYYFERFECYRRYRKRFRFMEFVFKLI